MAQEKFIKLANVLKKFEIEKKFLKERKARALKQQSELLYALSDKVKSLRFSRSPAISTDEHAELELLEPQQDQGNHHSAQAKSDALEVELSALEQLYTLLCNANEKLASEQTNYFDGSAKNIWRREDDSLEFLARRKENNFAFNNTKIKSLLQRGEKLNPADKQDTLCSEESDSEDVEDLLKFNVMDEATAAVVGVASDTQVKKSFACSNIFTGCSFEGVSIEEDFSLMSTQELQNKFASISEEVSEQKQLTEQIEREMLSLAASLRSTLSTASRVRQLAPVLEAWHSHCQDLDSAVSQTFSSRNGVSCGSMNYSISRASEEHGSTSGFNSKGMEKPGRSKENGRGKTSVFPNNCKSQVRDRQTAVNPEEIDSTMTRGRSEEEKQEELKDGVSELIALCDQIIGLAKTEAGVLVHLNDVALRTTHD